MKGKYFNDSQGCSYKGLVIPSNSFFEITTDEQVKILKELITTPWGKGVKVATTGASIVIEGGETLKAELDKVRTELLEERAKVVKLEEELASVHNENLALKMIQINKSDKKNIQKQTKDGDISAENTVENPVINN